MIPYMLTKLTSVVLLTVVTVPSSAAGLAPPAELATYVQRDRYEPGDFAWVRGAFDDASPGEKAIYRGIAGWATRCLKEATTKLKKDLAARGYPDARIDDTPVGPLLCRQVAVQPRLHRGAPLRAFRRALARGTAVADGFLSAVALAESTVPSGASLSDALEARILGEQMLRHAASWGFGPMKDAPQLTEDERAIVLARITVAMLLRDYENTEAFKAFVKANGWPKISEVGARGAKAAWTLAQHADSDPIFQLEALQMMQALVPSGEVSKQDYAYLYDRVSLKLAGRQRYGTQTVCSKGLRMPQPLEDPRRIDELRREVGLSPEADYLRLLDQQFGPCAPN